MMWKSFRLPDGERRYIYTDEDSAKKITDKEWFNKNTQDITIYTGYETEEYNTAPISESIYYIIINYQISNYFGDKSGMHYRNKEYVLIGDKLYQQKGGSGTEVKRLTKELSGILKETGQGK